MKIHFSSELNQSTFYVPLTNSYLSEHTTILIGFESQKDRCEISLTQTEREELLQLLTPKPVVDTNKYLDLLDNGKDHIADAMEVDRLADLDGSMVDFNTEAWRDNIAEEVPVKKKLTW